MSNTYPTYAVSASGLTFRIAEVQVGPGRFEHESGVMIPDSVVLIGTPICPADQEVALADGTPCTFYDKVTVTGDDVMSLIVLANTIDAGTAWRQVLIGESLPVTLSTVRGGAKGFAREEGDEYIVLFLRLDTTGIQQQIFPCEETAEELLSGVSDLRSLFAKKTKKAGKAVGGTRKFDLNARARRPELSDDELLSNPLDNI